MASYRPANKKTSSPRGKAEFKLSPDKTVAQYLLTYKDGKETKSLKARIAVSDLPDEIQAGLKAGVRTMWLSVSSDGTKVFSGYPLSGVYEARFSGIPHKENEVPMYKSGVGQWGEYHTWVLLHEIVEGPFAGAVVPQFLPYNFEGYIEDNKWVARYSKDMDRSEPTKNLDVVMGVVGLWNAGPIPWKEQEDGTPCNILPRLLARGLVESKKGLTYSMVLEDGQVTKIIGKASGIFQDEAEDDADVWDDEVVSPKIISVSDEIPAVNLDDPFFDGDSTEEVSGVLQPDVVSDPDEIPWETDED